MTDAPRKVSFILQFTETAHRTLGAAEDAGARQGQAVRWRAALEEVSSGERRTIASYEGLAGGLAAHGVALAHEKPDGSLCAACRISRRAADEVG